MRNFKIIFETYILDGNGGEKPAGPWVRIIVAQSLEWAEKIAAAMKDEEVQSGLFLGDPVIVEETGEDPNVNSLDDAETWTWVIGSLGLDDDDVELIHHPSDPKTIVGIKVK